MMSILLGIAWKIDKEHLRRSRQSASVHNTEDMLCRRTEAMAAYLAFIMISNCDILRCNCSMTSASFKMSDLEGVYEELLFAIAWWWLRLLLLFNAEENRSMSSSF